MQVLFINMGNDDRLRIVSESLTDESFGYLVGELGRDVVFGRERLNVVNSLHRAFPVKWRSGGEAVAGVLVVHELHLLERGRGIGHAINGGRVQQVLGLIGVQYVG